MTTRSLLFLSLYAAILATSPAVAQTTGAGDECIACHGERDLTMERGGKTVSLFVDSKQLSGSPHAELSCVKCHVGFKADELPHAARIRPVNCLACHDGERFDHYAESVHARAKPSVGCAACHGAHAVRRVSDKDPAVRHELSGQVCARCHTEVSGHYAASDHGKALAQGVKGAPSCIDCHGEHEVVSPADTAAKTSRLKEAAMCLTCHVDNPEVRARVGPSAGFISSYEQSVHGQALHGGNTAAATCTDCHGSHDMMKGSNPASQVAKRRIAETCAQCHADVSSQYVASIHGKAVTAGEEASATCTDCHGEHGILSPSNPNSPVAPTNVSAQVCSPCHASVSLTRKYGLRSDRFQSFEDSYHGLATRAGSVEVANCASCHGVHDIKPSSDPTSRIAPANLAATCGSCHPGATQSFTMGAVHVIATAGNDDILSIIATVYIVLIVVIIGGMLAHNLLDFVRRSRRKLQQRRGLLPVHTPPHRLYLRMTVSERVQHGTFAMSFTLLVVTGFALRFPDAWWVAPFRDLSPWTFNLRGLLHRVAGVVMLVGSLYHMGYLAGTARGRQLVRDLMPTWKDFTDVLQLLRYNLGWAPHRPRFGRFSYMEKAEYLALVWGTALMAVTGIILWFDNTFMNLLTKLGWDIARTVHYYEAWLAMLSILVWHFYFVIFSPDAYPVNLTAFTGMMTEEEMEDEHSLELEAIKRREQEGEEVANQ
jgi:cytochrome b subunit of formate dehydrogenase